MGSSFLDKSKCILILLYFSGKVDVEFNLARVSAQL